MTDGGSGYTSPPTVTLMLTEDVLDLVLQQGLGQVLIWFQMVEVILLSQPPFLEVKDHFLTYILCGSATPVVGITTVTVTENIPYGWMVQQFHSPAE